MKIQLVAMMLMLAGVCHAQYAVVRPAASTEVDAVAKTLLRQYDDAYVCVYTNSVSEVLPALRARHPRYVAFLFPTGTAGRETVALCHTIMAQIDDDPYDDALWGIISGALLKTLATPRPPLTIQRTLSNTVLRPERLVEARMYSELTPGILLTAENSTQTVSTDIAGHFATALNADWPDALVTSAHATERNLAPGFSFNGGMLALAQHYWQATAPNGTTTTRIAPENPKSKIWLACGNCLIGHLDPHTQETMANASFATLGVRQMAGYTLPTWFGYMGWGVVDYFYEQPGRFTFAESFFANHQALRWLLAKTTDANMRKGLTFDRDVCAFYGDPAWQARLASKALDWEQTLTETNGVFTFTIVPRHGDTSFATRDTNGSQRGGRPLFARLPRRINTPVKVLSGAELQPVITDDFILVPRPAPPLRTTYCISFRP